MNFRVVSQEETTVHELRWECVNWTNVSSVNTNLHHGHQHHATTITFTMYTAVKKKIWKFLWGCSMCLHNNINVTVHNNNNNNYYFFFFVGGGRKVGGQGKEIWPSNVTHSSRHRHTQLDTGVQLIMDPTQSATFQNTDTTPPSWPDCRQHLNQWEDHE